MDESGKKQISNILDAFDARRDAARQKAQAEKTRHEQFLEQFAAVSVNVIRPVMEQFRDLLKARGHDAAITERPESAATDGRKQEARIELTVFPLGKRPGYPNQHDCPHVAFIASSYEDTVTVHESTMMPGSGGQSGSAGTFRLDQVNAALVERHILRVLSAAMGK